MTENEQVSLEDIMVSSEPSQTLTVKVKGKSFDLTYRPLSWLDKTDCVARATEYRQGEDGEIQSIFHIDIYFEEALKRMITNAPWPMSRQVLRGLKPAVGQQLQGILPSPFDNAANLDSGSAAPSKTPRRKRKTRSSHAAQSN